MDIEFHFAMTDIFFLMGMISIAIVAAFSMRSGWIKRIVVSSYIALAIVLALPQDALFSAYADVWFFVGITLVMLFLGYDRLFDTDGGWGEGRVPVKTIIFGFIVVGLLVSIILSFMPASDVKEVMSRSMRGLFVSDFWFIFWLVAPLLYVLIFDRR